jgi:uncharacterized protein YdhG (YjbR/CyaY superfamily)
MRGSALKTLKEDLQAYDTSNTVVRFAPDEPLPSSLVKKIVEVRLGEIEANTAPGGQRRTRTQDDLDVG